MARAAWFPSSLDFQRALKQVLLDFPHVTIYSQLRPQSLTFRNAHNGCLLARIFANGTVVHPPRGGRHP